MRFFHANLYKTEHERVKNEEKRNVYVETLVTFEMRFSHTNPHNSVQKSKKGEEKIEVYVH